MAESTPEAHDPDPIHLGTVINMIAGSAILAGQVVGFGDSGVNWTVIPVNSKLSSTAAPIGVALYSQPTVGGKVAVAAYGSVILMREGAGAKIVPGDDLKASAAAGCVVPGRTKGNSTDFVKIGTALESAQANAYFHVLINGPVFLSKGVV